MKNTAIVCILCWVCLCLNGCVTTVDSASGDEMEIIDKNLRLKDKIAELENERNERETQIVLEKEIERMVLQFFLNINNEKFDEAEEKTTDNIEVTSSAIVIGGNPLEVDISNSSYLLQLVDTEWQSDQEVCLTFDIIQETGDSGFNAYIVNEDGEWKIDSFGMNY